MLDIVRSLGYPLRSVTYDEWLAEVGRNATSPDHALYPILGLLPGPGEITPDGHDPLATDVEYDCRNTLAGLQSGSLESPPVDGPLVQRWLTTLAQRGFIHHPGSLV
jgi:hypothetical protein